MSIGEHRRASALLRNIQNIRICVGKKPYRFCNLRQWNDFNKKQLTLLKMCVTSLLCGPRADLWPFYGFLCKRFSPIQILIFWMLRNNADARRCSYFELGLPVVSAFEMVNELPQWKKGIQISDRGKIPPETTSVGRCLWHGVSTLIISSPGLTLSFAEMWYEIGHSIPG